MRVGNFSSSMRGVLAGAGVIVALVAGGCGRSSSLSATAVEHRGFAIFDREATMHDALPREALQSLDDVAIDSGSSRLLARSRRFHVWVSRGEARVFGPASGSVICLHVLERQGRRFADQCHPEAEASDPLRAVVSMSGGAQGAPGFAPRELLVAGLVTDDVEQAWLGMKKGGRQEVPVVRNGYLHLTSEVAASIGFTVGGIPRERPLMGCQEC